MAYYFSPSIFMSGFAVPSAVVDKYIRVAGAVQIKALLYFLRHQTEGIDIDAAAEALGLPKGDITDAMKYWVDMGIVMTDNDTPAQKPAVFAVSRPAAVKPAVEKKQKPSREEVARRGLEDPQIAFMLREAEQKFGRVLKPAESSTFVWLYDHEGMDISVILMLLEFAVHEKSCTLSFIERTATEWAAKGINDIFAAEEELKRLQESRSAWRKVERAMGIEKRKPSENELKYAHTWVVEWGFGTDVLCAAYELCVDTISKFSMPYVKKILEGWHKDGVKTVADINSKQEAPAGISEKAQKPKRGSRKTTTDMDMVKQMLMTGGEE